MKPNQNNSKEAQPKVDDTKGKFAKVPVALLDAAIKQIYNSNGNIGQGIQLITQLQKCEKID